MAKNISKTKSRSGSDNRSLYLLLFSNLVTIYFAISQNWNLQTIMWIYWSQSVSIGLFNFIRIFQLKDFCTKNLRINNRPAKPDQATKQFIAFFFLIHYGGFHFVYLIFIISGTFSNQYGASLNYSDVIYIIQGSLLFFLNHLFSYFHHQPKDTKKQNIGTLMFYPYARILPMHLTLVIAPVIDTPLVLFLGLKTAADLIMHKVEHKYLR